MFDWSHDMYGNPTANYLILWSNGFTGADYAGGMFRSKRREQVGYADKTSQAALSRLNRLFPGTTWAIGPDGIRGDRSGGSASFQAIRTDGETE